MTVARGNVSVLMDKRSGQSSVSREKIITVLRTEYKWDMEDIIVFLSKVSSVGSPKLYLSFSALDE